MIPAIRCDFKEVIWKQLYIIDRVGKIQRATILVPLASMAISLFLCGVNQMESLVVLGAVNVMGIVIACVIGAVCGFLAGQLLQGRGLGLVGNIVVGIVGGLLFSFLFSTFDMGLGELVNQIVGGTIGAVILLLAISFIKKAT